MDSYAVIGNPIAHSRSPEIHEQFAKQCQQDMQYSALLSTQERFREDLDQFFKSGLGLNVTLPFKIDALHYADELSERAQCAGAVNTLIKKDGKIIGDNTDGEGLVRDLVNNLGVQLTAKSILIIGAGGATQGVLFPLLSQGVKEIKIANRTLEKAQGLSETFSNDGKVSAISINDLKNISGVDILINASSAGLSGESPVLPNNLADTFCYDMIYNKALTPFLSAAIASGCKQYADGLGMLVEQAAESFYLWRTIRPNTEPVLQALRESL